MKIKDKLIHIGINTDKLNPEKIQIYNLIYTRAQKELLMSILLHKKNNTLDKFINKKIKELELDN